MCSLGRAFPPNRPIPSAPTLASSSVQRARAASLSTRPPFRCVSTLSSAAQHSARSAHHRRTTCRRAKNGAQWAAQRSPRDAAHTARFLSARCSECDQPRGSRTARRPEKREARATPAWGFTRTTRKTFFPPKKIVPRELRLHPRALLHPRGRRVAGRARRRQRTVSHGALCRRRDGGSNGAIRGRNGRRLVDCALHLLVWADSGLRWIGAKGERAPKGGGRGARGRRRCEWRDEEGARKARACAGAKSRRETAL